SKSSCLIAEADLRQQLLDHFPAHVGEAEVAALEAEGEFLVVEAQEMEDGRLEIVNVDSVLSREESELVAGADGGAGLNDAARAVVIPIGVIKLDETDAALDQPPGQ